MASHYPDQAEPLWNLQAGAAAARRASCRNRRAQLFEETGLHVDVGTLAYVSESYDGNTHFLNATFAVTLRPSTRRCRPSLRITSLPSSGFRSTTLPSTS